MLKCLKWIALATLVVWCAVSRSDAADTFFSISKITLAVPQVAFELDDLDMRDAQNRPIRNVLQKQRFIELFVRSLNRQLIENLTPRVRATVAFMSERWDIFSGWLRRSVQMERATLQFPLPKKIQDLIKRNSEHGSSQGAQASVRPPSPQVHQLILSSHLSSTQILR